MANQAWQITSPGSLTLKDLGSVPTPGRQEVLVRICAVALNYRDKLITEHNPAYPLIAKPDLIPGSDGAGLVEEAGPGSKWKKGDRVVIQPNTWLFGMDNRDFKLDKTLGGGEIDGTFRRWMVVSDEMVFRAPGAFSMEEASTLYTAGVTAYRALFYGGIKVEPGMTVLTQGTGGVSCYAIMIAAAAGATVVATSSTDEKLEVARKLGATHLINYRKTPDWASQVLEVTGGTGVDIVIDVVGAQAMENNLKSTRFAGIVAHVGMLSEDPAKPVNIMTNILFGAKTVRGFLGAGSRQMAQELSAFIENHPGFHPPIATTFNFEEADKALQALDNLNAAGKIVVRC